MFPRLSQIALLSAIVLLAGACGRMPRSSLTVKASSATNCEAGGNCVKNPAPYLAYTDDIFTTSGALKRPTSGWLLRTASLLGLTSEPTLITVATPLKPFFLAAKVVRESADCPRPFDIKSSNPTHSTLASLEAGTYKTCVAYIGANLTRRVFAMPSFVVDTTAPTGSATVTKDSSTANTADISWTAATDDRTAAADLVYSVYTSDSVALTTIDEVDASGTLRASDLSGSTLTVTMTGLSTGVTYRTAIVATDEVGNRGVVATGNITTIQVNKPVFTISAPSPLITNDGPVVYTLSYSNSSSITLAAGDITVTPSGSASYTAPPVISCNPIVNSEADCTVTLNSTSGDGTLTISVAADTAANDVGGTADAVGPSDPVTIDNTVPVVNAGTDKNVKIATLQDATASDDYAMTYLWEKVSGPGVLTFGTGSAVDTTIAASLDGDYVVRLTATDTAGNATSDTLNFRWDTTLPAVNAGADITTKITASRTATVTEINSPTYAWTQISGPGILTFSTASAITTDITADTNGVYVARLTVTDLAGNSAYDELTYTWDTVDPAVNAGTDKNVKIATLQDATVTDATALTYAWTQTGGPGTITFGSATASDTTVSADTDGSYTIKLTATDAAGNTAFDTATFYWDTTLPTVNVGADMIAKVATSRSATVTEINSPTYAWTQVSGPGTLTFSASTAVTTDISANTDGVYVARLTVTDAAGNSASDDLTFTWDTTAPTVNAGTDKNVKVLTLQDATASDATAMTYAWTQTAGAGTITFGSATAVDTNVSADTDGSYTLTLTVTDAAGNSNSDTATFYWDTTLPTVAVGADVITKIAVNRAATVTEVNSPTYAWTQVGGSNQVQFSAATAATTDISATTDGTYTVRLTVTDGASNVASDDLTFTWDTTAPSVDAGAALVAKIATSQDATVTDATALTYLWTKQSGPGAFIFGTDTAEDTTIAADTDGDYVALLTVTDAAGNVGTDTTTVRWDTTAASVPASLVTAADANNGSDVRYDNDTTAVYLAWAASTDVTSFVASYTVDWYAQAACGGGSPTTVTGVTNTYYALTTLSNNTTYSFTVKSVDQAGNVSSASACSGDITIDTSAPAAPTSLITAADANNGSDVRYDNDTSEIYFAWTAPADATTLNYTVTWYDQGACGGTATDVASLSTTYYQLSSPVNGTTYSFKVKAIDSAGNVGTLSSCSGNIIVDTTAPSTPGSLVTAADSAAGADTRYDNDTTSVYFVWGASTDSASGVASYTVDWYALANCGGSATSVTGLTSTNYQLSTISTATTYSFKVTALDNATNTGTTSSCSGDITIDTTNPVVNVDADIITKIAVNRAASVTEINSPTYAWTQVGGSNQVQFSAATAATTDISATTDGVYTVRLTVTDGAGNTGSDDLTFTWDTTAPTITSIGTNPRYAKIATAQTTTITDNLTTMTYSWTQTGQPLGGTLTFTTASSASPTISGDVEGSYTALLTVTDQAGNIASDTLTFVWDITNPSVNAGTDKAASTSISQDATASDTTSPISYLWTKQSGTGTITFGTATAEDTTMLPSVTDSYTARLTVTDFANNSNFDEMTFLYDTSAPSTPTGLITAADSSGGADVRYDDDTAGIYFAWTAATDTDSLISSYTVDYYSQANCGGTTTSVTGVTNAYYNLTPTVTGTTYSFKVTAINGVGTSGTQSSCSGNILVDSTAPTSASSLILKENTCTTQVTSGYHGTTTLCPSWTAGSDAESGVASYTVNWYAQANCGGSATSTTGVTNTYLSKSGLANGSTYSYTLTTVNGAGLTTTSSCSGNVMVDTSAPGAASSPYHAADASNGANIDTDDDASIYFGWTAATDAQSAIASYTVDYYAYANCVGASTTVTGITNTYYNLATAADRTTYSFKVKAINGAGLTGSSTTCQSATGLSVYTTPPAAFTILAPVTMVDATATVNWDASEGANSYVVALRTSGSNCAGGTVQTSASLAKSVTSHTFSGLSAGNYEVCVTATNTIGSTVAGPSTFAADTTVPTAGGGSGTTITLGTVTTDSVALSWNAATDDSSSASNLDYMIYYSAGNNIDTVANAEANGTLWDIKRGTTSVTVNNLAANTTYYFNVVVRDEAENKAVYTTTAGQATLAFCGGAGTGGDPYQVCTLAALQNVKNNGGASFIQTANIDASYTYSMNSGSGFDPIGSSGNPFTGSYNGQNYKITKLHIDRSTTNYVGLFGYISTGATIQNVELVDALINGQNDVGGLVGFSLGTAATTISTIKVSGSVIGRQYVGGIVGYTAGTVYRASMVGLVTATLAAPTAAVVGGVVGDFYPLDNAQSISQCSFRGTLEGNSYLGGIAARVTATDSTTVAIKDSHSEGHLYYSDAGTAGGIVGSLQNAKLQTSYSQMNIYTDGTPTDGAGGIAGVSWQTAVISDSFAVSLVQGATGYKGNGVGYQVTPASLTNSYAFNYPGAPLNCMGTNTGTGSCTNVSTGRTFWDKTNAPLSSWDFTSIWQMPDDGRYPKLQWEYTNTLSFEKRFRDGRKVSYSDMSSYTISGFCATQGSAITLKEGVTTLGSTTCSGGTWSVTMDLSAHAEGSFNVDLQENAGTAVSLTLNKATTLCDAAGERTGVPFASGSGTVGSPYVICTTTQLSYMGTNCAGTSTTNCNGSSAQGKYFKLGDNIDISSGVTLPLGGSSNKFYNDFDGNNHVLKNMTISGSTGLGLFYGLGTATGVSSVYDLNLENVSVTNSSAIAGGLAGTISGAGTIRDIFVTGSLSAAHTYSRAGAIAGALDTAPSTTMRRLGQHAFVTGLQRFGGLFGYSSAMAGQTFENLSGYGEVRGSSSGASGLVGDSASATTHTLIRPYSSMLVSGTGPVAGVAYSAASISQGWVDARITTTTGGSLVANAATNIAQTYAAGELYTDYGSGGVVSTTTGALANIQAKPNAYSTYSYTSALFAKTPTGATLTGLKLEGRLFSPINTAYGLAGVANAYASISNVYSDSIFSTASGAAGLNAQANTVSRVMSKGVARCASSSCNAVGISNNGMPASANVSSVAFDGILYGGGSTAGLLASSQGIGGTLSDGYVKGTLMAPNTAAYPAGLVSNFAFTTGQRLYFGGTLLGTASTSNGQSLISLPETSATATELTLKDSFVVGRSSALLASRAVILRDGYNNATILKVENVRYLTAPSSYMPASCQSGGSVSPYPMECVPITNSSYFLTQASSLFTGWDFTADMSGPDWYFPSSTTYPEHRQYLTTINTPTSTLVTSSNLTSFSLSGTCTYDGTNVINFSGSLGSTVYANCSGGTWSKTLDFTGQEDGTLIVVVQYASQPPEIIRLTKTSYR